MVESYQTENYRKQGGDETVIGGTLQIGSAASLLTDLGIGAVAGTGASVVENLGQVHKTTITLEDLDILMPTVETSKAGGGTKIYDFPAGAIHILGCLVDLALETDLGASADITFALGTTLNADGDVADTGEANVIASQSVSFSSSAATVQAQSTTSEQPIVDGTSTAVDLHVNAGDQDDLGGSAKYVRINGTVAVFWVNLGDY